MTPTEVERQLRDHERRLDTQRARLDTHATELTELKRRLAAIERAATCGTGPNEPGDNSPSQADVGEVSASSPEQPPFQVGELLSDIEDMLKANEQDSRSSTPFKRGFRDALQWARENVKAMIAMSTVTPAPSPASVAIEPSAGAGDFDKALSALYAECNSTHWRDRVDANLRPVFDKLRAENERLKDDYQVAVNNIAYRSEELVEANREIERLKALDKDYCDSANKYAQEIGKLRAENERLRRDKSGADGYIDLLKGDREKLREQLTTKDAEITAMRAKLNTENVERFKSDANSMRLITTLTRERDEWMEKAADLDADLTTHREAAEAMEWLAKNPYCSLYYGFQYGSHKGWYVSGFNGVFRTPTAAILAAKAATTNTGEK